MGNRSRVARAFSYVFLAAATFALLCAVDAAAKSGSAVEVTGFAVEIARAGSGSDVDSAWETCSGGAVCIEPPPAGGVTGLKSVTELQLRGPLTAGRGVNENSYEVLENGAGRFKIEIEGAPVASANVESIFVEDLVIDTRDLTTGADWDYRVYGPGDAHYGSITIRSRVGKNSTELYEWWVDTSRGKNIRKSISVICLKRDGAEARRFNFHACSPTCYAPFEFSESGVATESITLRCEAVSMSTTSTRRSLCEWINDTVQGKDWKRSVTIKEITKDGGAGKSFTYQDCFPTRYVFPKWDASSKSVQIEVITAKMGRVELQ